MMISRMTNNKQKQPKAETNLAFKVFVAGAASIIWLIVTIYLIESDSVPDFFALFVLLLNVPALASYYLLRKLKKYFKIDKENMQLYSIVVPTLTYFVFFILIYSITFSNYLKN